MKELFLALGLDPKDLRGMPHQRIDALVKQQYRFYAVAFHPDTNKSAIAKKRMGEVQSAYDQLESLVDSYEAVIRDMPRPAIRKVPIATARNQAEERFLERKSLRDALISSWKTAFAVSSNSLGSHLQYEDGRQFCGGNIVVGSAFGNSRFGLITSSAKGQKLKFAKLSKQTIDPRKRLVPARALRQTASFTEGQWQLEYHSLENDLFELTGLVLLGTSENRDYKPETPQDGQTTMIGNAIEELLRRDRGQGIEPDKVRHILASFSSILRLKQILWAGRQTDDGIELIPLGRIIRLWKGKF